MKKVILSIVLSMMCFSMIFAAKKNPEYEKIDFDIATVTEGNITFTVNPAAELLFIAARLAEYEDCTYWYGGDYMDQIDTLFEKYKESDFVKKIKQYRSRNITTYELCCLASYLKPDFSGTEVALDPLPAELPTRLKKLGARELNSIVKDLHDFALKTNFSRIYILNKAQYLNFIGNVKQQAIDNKVLDWATGYFTSGNINKTVIHVSFFTRYAFGHYYIKNGQVVRTGFAVPNGNYYSTAVALIESEVSIITNSIWKDVEENYKKVMTSYVNKYFAEEKNRKGMVEVYTNPRVLDIFLRELCILDAIKTFEPESYDSVIETFKKTYIDPMFGDMVNCILAYNEKRNLYPEFILYAPVIKDFINGLKEIQ